MAEQRKRRSDRNHIIYLLTSPSGLTYVGITVMQGRAKMESMDRRWAAHCRNALEYGKDYRLSQCIREEGRENFRRQVIEVVRGKAEAHSREITIIKQMQTPLNMVGMVF